MHRKCGYCIIVLLLLHCLQVAPLYTGRLPAPELTFVKLTFTSDIQYGVREAVHLAWHFNKEENTLPHTYTLLRKLSGDSLFDVFNGSRGIPEDTTDFYDHLYNYTFPESGFDTICYRIIAVDTLGESGDTSAVCMVVIAPQPQLVAFDKKTGCLSWESWIRGGVFSWCQVLRETDTSIWTSEKSLEFPLTDKAATFSACMPDIQPGKWYYALFIQSSSAYSLTIGATDVP